MRRTSSDSSAHVTVQKVKAPPQIISQEQTIFLLQRVVLLTDALPLKTWPRPPSWHRTDGDKKKQKNLLQ